MAESHRNFGQQFDPRFPPRPWELVNFLALSKFQRLRHRHLTASLRRITRRLKSWQNCARTNEDRAVKFSEDHGGLTRIPHFGFGVAS